MPERDNNEVNRHTIGALLHALENALEASTSAATVAEQLLNAHQSGRPPAKPAADGRPAALA
jgi:hypothetical protein